MKRHEIYEEFRNKLKNETNEDIIKYINKTCLNGKYIDKFLYYSCGFDNCFIVKYILNNYKPYLEDSICNAIKYKNDHIVLILFEFVKNNKEEHEYYLNNINVYLNFMEKCVSHSNTNIISLITKYYSNGVPDFIVNFDNSLNKSLILSYLTNEQLTFILNYKHFIFSKDIENIFSQCIFLGKYDYSIVIFDNLKNLLINIDKQIIINLITNIIEEENYNQKILEIVEFYNLVKYLIEQKTDLELLKLINKIYLKNRLEDF